MKREIFKKLERWKESEKRKPLVLLGARQVGKTFSLKWLGEKHFNNFIYFNFEEDKHLKSLFEDSLAPETITRNLSLYAKQKVEDNRTLIIFDEIQECPRALTALKYFCEKRPSLHIAAAGSLLGLKVPKESGFPVGKVDFLRITPMTFLEFLRAQNEDELIGLVTSLDIASPIPDAFHLRLNDFLKIYFFVGGMPEAVQEYIKTKDFESVRKIQQNILMSYELDISKHARGQDIQRIFRIWEYLPKQLAKENRRFIFTALAPSARAREYESAMQWLVDAGLVVRVSNISAGRLPLSGYENPNHFKLYTLDVGLLAALAKLSSQTLVLGEGIFTEFKRAFTENFVAQELVARQIKPFYWKSEGKAEVDFVIESQGTIFPIEVKSGVNLKAKSLAVFCEQYKSSRGIRVSLSSYMRGAKVWDVPLYAVSLVARDITGRTLSMK